MVGIRIQLAVLDTTPVPGYDQIVLTPVGQTVYEQNAWYGSPGVAHFGNSLEILFYSNLHQFVPGSQLSDLQECTSPGLGLLDAVGYFPGNPLGPESKAFLARFPVLQISGPPAEKAIAGVALVRQATSDLYGGVLLERAVPLKIGTLLPIRLLST